MAGPSEDFLDYLSFSVQDGSALGLRVVLVAIQTLSGANGHPAVMGC